MSLPFFLLSALRRGKAGPDAPCESCGRVDCAYRLNELMSQSRSRRLLKKTVNGLLNVSSLGDSLKVWAER